MLSDELRNILFQRPPHGHDTWTEVRSVQSQAEARRATRLLCSSLSVPSLHCVTYSCGRHPILYRLMTLTFGSSSATPDARVENRTLPSHEPSAQTERLFLRKHGSGSQRRKLAFRSKYNPPLETGVSAENWTVNLL